MKNLSQDDFNRLLKQYKALSDERLQIDNEILKVYDSLTVNKVVTITSDKTSSDKFMILISLRKRLKIVNQEMKKIDKEILESFQENQT